jgi:membrane protease subunit HflK
MERLFGGTDKIIVDSGSAGGTGVIPFLPLNELMHKPAGTPGTSTGGTR